MYTQRAWLAGALKIMPNVISRFIKSFRSFYQQLLEGNLHSKNILKLMLAILIINSNTAMAESAKALFSTADNFTNESTVKWIQVADIQTECNKQRAKFGAKPFSGPVKACSTWTKSIFGKDQCLVITEHKTSLHIIGHEIRHCFAGFWKGHEAD